MQVYCKIARNLLLILALGITLTATAPTQAQGQGTADGYHQWAINAKATSEYDDTSWSANQTTGQPNSDTCGDNGKAWASKTATGIDDLIVMFDQPVTPSQVNIHENYNPGYITSIDLVPVEGKAIPVANSADSTTTACPGVLSVKVTGVQQLIQGVVIHLNQTKAPGWDEIDAVELIGQLPTTLTHQWASGASATSQYGNPDWAATQATGTPDVKTCADNGHAWASSSSEGIDALTVTFNIPMVPSGIHIYQTDNPGSITSIDLLPADGGSAMPVPNSADSTATPCPGVFAVNITGVTTPITGVVIHVNQTKIANWDEIDAVELLGQSVNSATPAATGSATSIATMNATDAASMRATSAANSSESSASGEATQAATQSQ